MRLAPSYPARSPLSGVERKVRLSRMNVYALIAMATVQASIVGVTEMLTLTAQVHAAEGGRPELFAPLYGFALLCFFLYCYPIDRLTARLERRFETA